jgi:exodeoxyribonuclease V alpha subunit
VSDVLRGTVRKVFFRSDTFHIFSLAVEGRENYKPTTVKGNLYGVSSVVEGMTLEVLGGWVDDPKFGRQIQLSGWRPWAPTGSSARFFLVHCLGLPEAPVEALVAAFGKDTFSVLVTEPDKVRALYPEGSFVADLLGAWAGAQASADVAALFSGDGFTAHQMQGIIKTFGVEAREVLSKNPYELLRVETLPFAKVDAVARRLGLGPSDPRRHEGAVLWVLREAARSGHLCVSRNRLAATLTDLSQAPEVSAFAAGGLSMDLSSAVDRLALRKLVVDDPEAGVYLPHLYGFERDAATAVAALLKPMQLGVGIGEFLRVFESRYQIELSEAQRGAIEALARSKALVVTGPPGTGKTTLVRAIVSLLDSAGLTYALMAPTGIAAKRLASVTMRDAATIHRTLRYNGTEWGFDRTNRLPVEAVIVDEMSMVDQELFFRITDALSEGAVLVLVGDEDQLPSVGPGNVLRDIAESGVVPVARLTQIFRQRETSEIVTNAHRIKRGEGIVTEKGRDGEFQFVAIEEESRALELIVRMAEKLKDRNDNFQILSSKYEGVVGVNTLNQALREALNPPSEHKAEFEAGDLRIREGDRVMIVQNDYQLAVYNGDMAKLLSVGREALTLKIHGGGEGGIDRLIDVPKSEAAQKLRLAYAITVHRCQGSEFATVIVPIFRSQGRMLQRNLLYTAITRARRKVWLLGDPAAVSRAIANDKVVRRQTGFALAIRKSVAGVEPLGLSPPTP